MSVLSLTASVASGTSAMLAAVHSATGGLLLSGETTEDRTVLVALIGAIGLVLATAITAVAAAWKRSPAVSQTDLITKQYIQKLENDSRKLGQLTTKHNHLREACIERGMDPDHLIYEQETS